MKDRGWARVYFIDGKESRSGVKCPVISESRMSEEKRAGGGLSRTHPFLREGVGEGFGSLGIAFSKGKPYGQAEIRSRHPKG